MNEEKVGVKRVYVREEEQKVNICAEEGKMQVQEDENVVEEWEEVVQEDEKNVDYGAEQEYAGEKQTKDYCKK
jgi:DNA-binding transcriptional regulator of glucitol operon